MTYASTILADGPQLFYRLGESSGIIATDSSGNGNSGTLSGVTAYGVAGPVSGDSTTAISFSNIGGVAFPNRLQPNTYTALTLEFWILLGSGWQYVTVTNSTASGMTVYYNGAVTTPGPGASILVDTDLFFAGSFLAGTLANVALYNKILTTTQISAHFQAAQGVVLTTHTASQFGGFLLNNPTGGYYLTSKSLDFPTIQEATYKIARLEGTKVTGIDIRERTIPVVLKIVASSRIDLENKIDALLGALAARQQPLQLHSNDARYFTANCDDVKIQLVGTQPITVQANITFFAPVPYAYAPVGSSFDTGSLVMPIFLFNLPNASTYQSNVSVASGGNVWAYPTIKVTLTTPSTQYQLSSFISGSGVTSLPITPPLAQAAVANDAWWIGFGNSPIQAVVSSGAAGIGSAAIPTNSFTANATYPAGTTIKKGTTTAVLYSSGQFYGSLSFQTPLSDPVFFGDTFLLNLSNGAVTSVIASQAYPAGVSQINAFSWTPSGASYAIGTTVFKDTRPSGLTVTDVTDTRSISISQVEGLFQTSGEWMTIVSDPTNPSYGISKDGTFNNIGFTGIFPVLQPLGTAYTVQVTCPSQPSIDCLFTWVARWLS